jgi:hypothetical protein
MLYRTKKWPLSIDLGDQEVTVSVTLAANEPVYADAEPDLVATAADRHAARDFRHPWLTVK